MLEPNFFNTFLIFPILNVLVAFYKLFLLVKVPGAFGFAVIALTVLIRVLLHPFFDKQLQTTKKMQDIKPHLDKLSLKHKKDPKKLQEEQMRLYKEAGINPAAGCLFLVVQMPVFIGLYNTLSLFLSHKITAAWVVSINKTLYFPFLKIHTIDPWFFGYNIALSPSQAGQWHYYLIPVITGVLQYLQVTATTPPKPQPSADRPLDEKTSKKDKKPEKSSSEDFQKAMQTQMKYVFPIMIGYFSYTLPAGLSLYWNIFSLFSIMQYKIAHQKSAI